MQLMLQSLTMDHLWSETVISFSRNTWYACARRKWRVRLMPSQFSKWHDVRRGCCPQFGLNIRPLFRSRVQFGRSPLNWNASVQAVRNQPWSASSSTFLTLFGVRMFGYPPTSPGATSPPGRVLTSSTPTTVTWSTPCPWPWPCCCYAMSSKSKWGYGAFSILTGISTFYAPYAFHNNSTTCSLLSLLIT